MKINPTILTDDKDDYAMQIVRDAGFSKELDIDVIDWSLSQGKTITAEQSLNVPAVSYTHLRRCCEKKLFSRDA